MNWRFSRTSKMIAATGLVFLAVLFGFVYWAGGKAVDFVREKAATQDFLAGKLTVGDMGASFNGDVWLSEITWVDPDGKLVAKIPRLSLAVRLRDILSGLGAGSVQTIMLERPELHLLYDAKGGLNILRLIKDTGEKTSGEKDAISAKFRGSVEISKGLLEIISGGSVLRYEGLDGKLSYSDFPKVAGTMQAKQNKADFAGRIELDNAAGSKKMNISLEGRSIALKEFLAMVQVKNDLTISDGNINVLQVMINGETGKPLTMMANGEISGLRGEADGIKIADFKGSFSGNNDEVSFTQVTGQINEQPVSVNGKVDLRRSPYPLDIKISSGAFNLAAVNKGIGVNGILSFNAGINGTLNEPVAKGNFSMAALKTEQMEITNARGDFTYKQGIVGIYNASAAVYGGTVGAAGSVNLSDDSFNFDLDGRGINSTAMTETKIHGPLSFAAKVKGAGNPNEAAANGSFVIGKGDFNGIPFNSLTGSFTKRGSDMTFSDITVNTLAGTVKTKAAVSNSGKIRFENIDLSTAKKEDIEGQVKRAVDRVGDAIKKLF